MNSTEKIMNDNIIKLEPYLSFIATEKLIDSICEKHEGSEEERRYIRGYLRAELSDNPEFWHKIRLMHEKE